MSKNKVKLLRVGFLRQMIRNLKKSPSEKNYIPRSFCICSYASWTFLNFSSAPAL